MRSLSLSLSYTYNSNRLTKTYLGTQARMCIFALLITHPNTVSKYMKTHNHTRTRTVTHAHNAAVVGRKKKILINYANPAKLMTRGVKY